MTKQLSTKNVMKHDEHDVFKCVNGRKVHSQIFFWLNHSVRWSNDPTIFDFMQSESYVHRLVTIDFNHSTFYIWHKWQQIKMHDQLPHSTPGAHFSHPTWHYEPVSSHAWREAITNQKYHKDASPDQSIQLIFQKQQLFNDNTDIYSWKKKKYI